jgi:hypothetical protein
MLIITLFILMAIFLTKFFWAQMTLKEESKISLYISIASMITTLAIVTAMSLQKPNDVYTVEQAVLKDTEPTVENLNGSFHVWFWTPSEQSSEKAVLVGYTTDGDIYTEFTESEPKVELVYGRYQKYSPIMKLLLWPGSNRKDELMYITIYKNADTKTRVKPESPTRQ